MYNNPNRPDRKGMAVASLVLGIIGLLAWLLPILGAPINIVGLILGASSMKSSRKGMAVAGLVMSIIGLILTIINAVLGAYLASQGLLF